jgi:hypothetical protein
MVFLTLWTDLAPVSQQERKIQYNASTRVVGQLSSLGSSDPSLEARDSVSLRAVRHLLGCPVWAAASRIVNRFAS